MTHLSGDSADKTRLCVNLLDLELFTVTKTKLTKMVDEDSSIAMAVPTLSPVLYTVHSSDILHFTFYIIQEIIAVILSIVPTNGCFSVKLGTGMWNSNSWQFRVEI